MGCSSVAAAKYVFENHTDVYDAAAPGGGAYVFARGSKEAAVVSFLEYCRCKKDPKRCILYDKANYNKFIKDKR